MPDTKIKCPTCEQMSLWDSRNKFRPFCSERCKLIDLGAWANEEYTIPESTSASDFSSSENEDQIDRDRPSISPMH
ncbi:DNA gyrase inhibitor YacG [uncultured Neptuniibacter sp.]|uniref:DNA gyrase inhibitor YacG n=1 Tax=uncultured Neptuniibacter sp. TaxID=502143 RepID=UPI002625BA97|nr:DNA gyrase inhibitor YacG [uncultured Neptuniibacter sp.]